MIQLIKKILVIKNSTIVRTQIPTIALTILFKEAFYKTARYIIL